MGGRLPEGWGLGGAGPPPGNPAVRKEHPHRIWHLPLQLEFPVSVPFCGLSHLPKCAWETPRRLLKWEVDSGLGPAPL